MCSTKPAGADAFCNEKMNTKKSLLCGFCKRGIEVENVCGKLHAVKINNGSRCVAHHKCMQYSALLVQYKFGHFGGFKINKVQDEINRGRLLKCTLCKSKKGKKWKMPFSVGATCGCALASCQRTFHFYCAKMNKDVITKRFGIRHKALKKRAILYRVFCSRAHEKKYIQKLTYGYIDELKDENSDEDEEMEKKISNSNNDEKCVELVQLDNNVLDMDNKGISKLFKTVDENFFNEDLINESVRDDVKSAANRGDEIAKPSSNHTSDTIKHEGEISCSVHDNLCILCIPKILENSKQQRNKILSLVKSRYKVCSKNIYLWSDIMPRNFQPEYVEQFIYDLSKMIREQSFDELYSILFEFEQKHQGKYICMEQMKRNNELGIEEDFGSYIWESVAKNLKVASLACDREVGILICVGEFELVVLMIDNFLDKSGHMREQLGKMKSLQNDDLKNNSSLELSGMNDLKSVHLQDSEYSILKTWLSRNVGSHYEVYYKPSDEIISAPVLNSMTERLRTFLLKHSTGLTVGNQVNVLCIGHVDETLISYRDYCCKLLKCIARKVQREQSTLYCIFDIGLSENFSSCMDGIPVEVTETCSVAVYSAFDPAKSPLSCIVIKMSSILGDQAPSKISGISHCDSSSILPSEKEIAITSTDTKSNNSVSSRKCANSYYRVFQKDDSLSGDTTTNSKPLKLPNNQKKDSMQHSSHVANKKFGLSTNQPIVLLEKHKAFQE